MSVSKVVLVTGCSEGGIGFALCEEFANQGCKVYATARKIESMKSFQHPSIERLVLDVLDEDNIRSVVQTIMEAEGKIDVLVNNAGTMGRAGPLLDIPLDIVQRTFDTNTFAVLRMVQAVVPYMAARKSGTVVNVGSFSGELSSPWNGIYGATKSSLLALTETLFMECKPLNVSVMLVVPGAIRSNIAINQMSMFTLPPNSLYTAYVNSIVKRITASQGSNSMPAEIFAKRVVAAALRQSPPMRLALGGFASLFRILLWMPRRLVLWLMWRNFSQTN